MIEIVIKSLLEYIEIWDESLQIDFSCSIYKIFFIKYISEFYNYDFYFNNNNEHLTFMNIKEKVQKDILTIYYNTTDIINPIIKFIMKMISNGDNTNLVKFKNKFFIFIFKYFYKIN